MSIIIIEGCDGSGKTSFISELSHHAPPHTQMLKCGPLRQHPIFEYVLPFMTYSPVTDFFICDRWHLGELVYGPLYRGKSRITPAMFLYIEAFLTSTAAIRVIMDTRYETIIHRLDQRGEDFLLPQHRRLVVDWYDEVLTEIPSWVGVEPNMASRPEYARSLINTAIANALSTPQDKKVIFSEFSEKPRVLIVGKQVKHPSIPSGITSLLPWENSPLHDILTALTFLGLTSNDIAILESDEPKLIQETWLDMGMPTVISLDRDLTSRLAMIPITYRTSAPIFRIADSVANSIESRPK